MSDKQVPIVHYDREGRREIIGVCEVDGEKLIGTVQDTRWAEVLSDSSTGSFSIVPEGAQPSTKITMKILCPRCKKLMKEGDLTEAEKEMFDDEELKAGEALHHRPCETCQAKADRRNW